MSSNYQYGRGLSDILLYGMSLTATSALIKELVNLPIEQNLLLHNLYESITSDDEETAKKTVQKKIRKLRAELTPKIKQINEWVDTVNKFIKGLDFELTVPSLDQEKILTLVETRLKNIYSVRDVQRLSNENFIYRLDECIQPTHTAILGFSEKVDEERKLSNIDLLGDPSKQGMVQAADICSIGYYSTSIFIAGRTVEECINKLYEKTFRLSIVAEFDLKKISLENKINRLRSENIIGEKLYHDLSSARINRNDFGHPSEKILNKVEAHLNLNLSVKVLIELEKVTKKIKRKT